MEDPFKDFYYFDKLKEIKEEEAEQIYRAALDESLKPAAIEYKTKKKDKVFDKRRLKVYLLTVVLALGISLPVANRINTNKVNQVTTEIAMPLTGNKQFGNVNPETGTPFWWYNEGNVYRDFDSQENYSVDEQVFASYMTLKNEYNGMKTLNGIVKHLTGLVDFEEFLKSRGYKPDDVKSWVKDMNKQILEEIRNQDNAMTFEERNMGGR